MNNKKYRWFQPYEKEKLEKLLKNQSTLELIYGMTDKGWDIVDYKILIDINKLAKLLGREPKTIKNELIRGCIQKNCRMHC